MIIYLPSISAEVELKKAENAWKPTVKDKNDRKPLPELSEMEDLKKKVLAILNITKVSFGHVSDD